MEKNEIIKRLLDPKWYLEHFAKIKGKTPGLQPFILNEAQKDLFNSINTHSRVIILKARQIGFCLSEHTNVLLSNLEWKTLKDIKVGEKIIAVDEFPEKGAGRSRKIKEAIVEDKNIVFERAYKLTMEDGRVLELTGEHRMMAKRWESSTETVWKKAKDFNINDSIRFITRVWKNNPSFEDGWFSGVIDGEGSLANMKRAGTQLTISQANGPVWDRLLKYAQDNNLTYRIEIDRRVAGSSSKLGSKEVNKLVLSRTDELIELIGRLRPARFIERKFLEGKSLPNNGWCKIIKIEKLGKQRMIDLQTSEKTYIANGFVSHNSTAITGYLYHKTITTPGTNTALIGYNSDMTAELLDKVKTFYRTTPEAIRPQIQYNSKYEISFPAIDSKILVLPSSENVGRGYTLHNVLCVSGETVVFGKNGKLIKVSNILPGDFVVNGNGGISTVKRIIKKKTTEKMFSIDVTGTDGILKVTENHKILTRNGWKKAVDITTKDHVAYPYFQLRNKYKEIDFSKYFVKSGSFIKISKVQLNRDFGELCGWFAAEGSVRNSRISFSINIKEEDYLVSLIKNVFGNELGKISINRKKDSLGSVVSITSQQISSFFVEKFGSGALNKTISDSCWYYGWEFGYGFLKGVFLGDGYFQGDNRRVILRSISPSLVYQVKKMLVSLRIGLASIQSAETNRYGVTGKDVYSLSLSGPGNYKFRRKLGFKLPIYNNRRFKWILENDPGRNYGWKTWLRGKFYYWMKVRSVKEINREDFVYDIVLPNEPHSFLTNAGIVSNCTELAFWDKAEEKMLAIENSVPQDGKIIIESTPNAIGNLYHRMFMADNDYDKKKYGWWWHYTEEEIEIIKRRINNPLRFAQEYGLEFLSSGRPVFDTALVKRLRKGILKVGDKVKNEDGTITKVVETDDGVIKYFEPRPDGQYVVGADVAEGVLGGDYSTFSIFDKRTGHEVAFWRGYMAPEKFGAFLDKYGRIYNDALMVVEINNHGLTTVTALKNKQYKNLYFRPVTKMDTMGIKFSDRLGWKTTKMTKPLMMDDLREALSDGDLIIHTEKTLDEMLTFVFNDDGLMVTQSSFHDDCIFSNAICFQGFKVCYSGKLEQIDESKHLPNDFSY